MSLYNRGIHNQLFDRALDYLLERGVQVVLLPRTPDQYEAYGGSGAIIPRTPIDGPALLYEADVVLSAGGSMNREAVVLGVPTWTVFAGAMGAIDQALIDEGRMRILERPEQLEITKRQPSPPRIESLVDTVTQEILGR
jgi:predicted glycosyltransferase